MVKTRYRLKKFFIDKKQKDVITILSFKAYFLYVSKKNVYQDWKIALAEEKR